MILIQLFVWIDDIMIPNIRSLDLTLLLALDALYEERSVTRAADRLALSQPAVSGILSRLRIIFDDELYVRTSHGVVPTPRAEALASQVKHVISTTQALFDQDRFDPATAAFDVRLCGTDYINRVLFARLVQNIRRDAPKAIISITNPQNHDWGERDVLGDVDMHFASHDPLLPDPEGTLLIEEQLVCVSSFKAHDHNQYITLEVLCALPNIVGQRALRSTVSDRLTLALGDRGLTRNIVLDVPDFASVFRLMQVCELVAFLPGHLAAQHDHQLKRLRVDLDIPAARVFARWHRRFDNEPRHLWLRDMVQKTVSSLAYA